MHLAHLHALVSAILNLKSWTSSGSDFDRLYFVLFQRLGFPFALDRVYCHDHFRG